MSEHIERSPLAEVEAIEAAVFRIGQLARRLRTEHPELPIERMEPTAWALATGYRGTDVHAELEIGAGSVDGVHAWATALGTKDIVKTTDKGPHQAAKAEVVIHGVMVKVSGTRTLVGDEYAAWCAKRDQATEGPAAAGGAE